MVPTAFEFGFQSLGAAWTRTVRGGTVSENAAFAKVRVCGSVASETLVFFCGR